MTVFRRGSYIQNIAQFYVTKEHRYSLYWDGSFYLESDIGSTEKYDNLS